MKDKYFIITLDTEEDNQWDVWQTSTTKNSLYLNRFQRLCEKYGFVPVYLTTFGMAKDSNFIEYMKPKFLDGLCEIGMHLHAWDTPPKFNLNLNASINNRSYLIEYPAEIMRLKIQNITELLENTFEGKIISHRAGRWSMNETYFKLLSEFGYLVDCSVTPHISWETSLGVTGMPGTDYRNYKEKAYLINEKLLEVPVTVRKCRVFEKNRINSSVSFLREIKCFGKKKELWLRPDKCLAVNEMNKLIDVCLKEDCDYLMFMIHSTELMPGGSPNFPDEDSIEELYKYLDNMFGIISKNYTGISLKNYSIKHNFIL